MVKRSSICAWDSPSCASAPHLGDVLERAGAGLLLRDVDDIDRSVSIIMRSYGAFSRAARALYAERYDLAHHSPALMDALGG